MYGEAGLHGGRQDVYAGVHGGLDMEGAIDIIRRYVQTSLSTVNFPSRRDSSAIHRTGSRAAPCMR